MRKIVCALVLVVSGVVFVACEEEKIQVEELIDTEYTESDGDEDSSPIKTN